MVQKYFKFLILFLIEIVSNTAYGYSSISAGAFQGYQVIVQKESLYKTTTTLASTPTFGAQLQFQTTLGERFGLRFKYESVLVKYKTPSIAILSSENFRIINYIFEIPYQHSIHWQSMIKIAKKERVLFNIDRSLKFYLYKSTSVDYGYGISYDSENQGSLVYGAGTVLSMINFKSKDINNIEANNIGVDFEVRAKIGWIYESGWGVIFRSMYSTFYMPNNIDKNTGKEIKFFGEFVKSF